MDLLSSPWVLSFCESEPVKDGEKRFLAAGENFSEFVNELPPLLCVTPIQISPVVRHEISLMKADRRMSSDRFSHPQTG